MIRIGIICPSEIAFRRFLPALMKSKNNFEFIGISIASPKEWFGDLSNISDSLIDKQQISEKEKASTFINEYGGRIFDSYTSLIKSKEIDAIYIPLPPALHYKWAKFALENNKHVFLEKPFTTKLKDSKDLIEIARRRKLALHENYMFIFHNQLLELEKVIRSKEIGETYLFRITFGFPRRPSNDFRYNKKLGGGALLDAGGYTIKYASSLLGDSAKIISSSLKYINDFEVEIFGTSTMVNKEGTVAQLAFGMDNDYKCDIEIWGSKGSVSSGRILTAPVGYSPKYIIKKNQNYEERNLPSDDSFNKSIEFFGNCVKNDEVRQNNYVSIENQARLIDDFHSLL